jgi:hypothetical protein
MPPTVGRADDQDPSVKMRMGGVWCGFAGSANDDAMGSLFISRKKACTQIRPIVL